MWIRCHVLVILLLSLEWSSAHAQDRVTYIPTGTASPVIASGSILDFSGNEMTLRVGMSTQRIPADRIQHIETIYHPDHLIGQEQFRKGDTAEAIATLRRTVEKESRDWVKREILALLVRAELRQQDLTGAIRDFRTLLSTDLESRHWGIAPLIWSPQVISNALRTEMQNLLGEDDVGGQLLAASVLLLDPVLGERAERRLTALSRDVHPAISMYAKAQLWRLEIVSRQLSEITLDRWREQLERMPKELRPGPQYVMSAGLAALGDLRGAAAAALWIPFVYPDNEILSARALFDAAENLNRTGLNADSRKLYGELVVRYPWSRDAVLAREQLTIGGKAATEKSPASK